MSAHPREFSADDCPPTDERCRHLAGLRTIAAFEMFKGLLGLAGAIVLLIIRDRDMEEIAENLLAHLHINPDYHFAQAFIDAASRVNDSKIELVAGVAFVYMVFRFVEAYGLWKARVWAEWLAIISGSAYLPLEIVGVVRHHTAFHWAVLGINIVVVLYMVYVRWDSLRIQHAHAPQLSAGD